MRVVRKPDGREYHYAGHYGGAPRIYAEPFTLEYFAEIAEKQSPAPEIPHNQVRRLIAEFRASKLDGMPASKAYFRGGPDPVSTPVSMPPSLGVYLVGAGLRSRIC